MDPNACLILADQAISDCDCEAAADALDNYFDWRNGGGFEPLSAANSGKRGDVFAKDCHRRLRDLQRQSA